MSLYTLSFLCALALFALQVPGNSGKDFIEIPGVGKFYIKRGSTVITHKTINRPSGSYGGRTVITRRIIYPKPNQNKRPNPRPWPTNGRRPTVNGPGSSGGSRGSRGSRAPPSSSSSGPSVNPREIVNKHNDLRRGVRPSARNMLKMSWSKDLAAKAQRWADSCTLSHSPNQIRLDQQFGENLYMSSAPSSWDMAIQEWYDEVKRWKYGRGGKKVGHFTQIVWANSNLIGCGMAICPKAKYKYYYVCQYSPPGNYNYLFPYKKGPSCGDCPDSCENKLCTRR